MIQEHFQLQREPFNCAPSPQQYYPASAIESSRKSLVRLIERHQGPGLVIGPVGTGKSLLCLLIADSFRHRCRVVVLPSGRLSSRRALLQSILFELGLPYHDLDEGELRLALIDHVTNSHVCPQGILLLVDDGDTLSLPLLDELRSLTNLAEDGKSCVRLAMFGAPRLEEKFTDPRLESLSQRIAGRFYLEPFSTDETCQYIGQTFEDCGGNPREVFRHDALVKIHRACGGIPRLINQLADHALVLAALNNYGLVDSDCVDEAWADLQQLPMPYGGQLQDAGPSLPKDIVEFGILEPDDAPGSDNEEEGVAEPQFTPIAEQDFPDEEPQASGQNAAEWQEHKDDPEEANGEPLSEFDAQTEMTIVFHSSENPFGEDYDEEEIVFDAFISPDAVAQRHRRQFECQASHRLAQQMYELRQQAANETKVKATRTSEETLVVNDEPVRPEEPATDSSWHDDRCEILYLDDHVSQRLLNADRTMPSLSNAAPADVSPRDAAKSVATDPDRSYRNLFSQLRLRRG